MTMLVRAALAAVLLAAPALAADPEGFAGASAERVDEPVFDGQVVLYHAGKPGAEAVVLVHGLGPDGARDWAGLIPALSAKYEVFALDLPGFGLSDKGDKIYSPENYIRVIEKVLAPRVGRPFTLVGHSLGAAVSLGYTAAYPQRVKHLILADMAGVLQGAVYADYLARAGVSAKTGIAAGAPWLDSMLRGALGRMEGMPLDRDMVLRTPAMRQKFLRGDPATIAAFALGQHDFSEALRSIAVPTLVIWGEDDPIAPLRTGQMAASLISGARLVVLPGVGHTPMTQDSAHFNQIVLDELAGRTTLAPFAAAFSGAPGGGTAKCDGKDGQRYSGDLASLTLIECTHVDVSHARIGELRVLQSDVHLVDVQVLGGIYALRSQIDLVAGVVSGAPALKLDASDVDAVGTRFETAGPVAQNIGATPLMVRLSVAEVRRAGKTPRYVHDFVRLAPETEW